MYLGHGIDLSMSRDVIGHVIFFPRYLVFCRWSVDTANDYRYIWFGCKGPITPMSIQACIFPVKTAI